MKKAAIVTIGTEITDGQILNSNAKWLSQKLVDLNIEVALHLSAPDDPLLMKKIISMASETTDLILICGGLGPTSDDITRDVVSDFLSLPLEFSESSWLEVKAKLEARNVILREGHRRQCLFPSGASIYKNSSGVAPGFFVQKNQKHFWVLPGPPGEIESLWNDFVSSQIQNQFSTFHETQLKTWLCLGAPESELAYLTETFFANKPFTKKLGYRLQAPYVEIKLWHLSPSEEAAKAMESFRQDIEEFYVADQISDVNQQIQKKLQTPSSILIDDTCSSGLLLERLTQALGPLSQTTLRYSLRSPTSAPLSSAENLLRIESAGDQWVAQWQTPHKTTEWRVASPSNKKSKWREHYVVEKLILEWLKVL